MVHKINKPSRLKIKEMLIFLIFTGVLAILKKTEIYIKKCLKALSLLVFSKKVLTVNLTAYKSKKV